MTMLHPVDPDPAVAAWLASFAAAVRSRDYERARTLFAADAVGFGSATDRYVGLDELERNQWQHVWERTADFEFDAGTARCWIDDSLVLVVAHWSSVGTDRGAPRPRSGRASVGLICTGDGLKAIHSHFSMQPGTSA